MPTEDETQQSVSGNSLTRGKRRRTLMKWIRVTRRAEPPEQTPGGLEQVSATTLQALPASLDCSNLPNGVVELVIEDFEDPSRQLFDINDGCITLVDPGQCVPWASISGPPIAWAKALGPERHTAELQLTGDVQLARRVLAALPQPD